MHRIFFGSYPELWVEEYIFLPQMQVYGKLNNLAMID